MPRVRESKAEFPRRAFRVVPTRKLQQRFSRYDPGLKTGLNQRRRTIALRPDGFGRDRWVTPHVMGDGEYAARDMPICGCWGFENECF